MEFRPCIDIHNGKVKQIVGASLRDESDEATENFVSGRGADFFAAFFQEQNLKGGHIVMLNPQSSPYYEATKAQALRALGAYPGGFQIGGGITADNAMEFLDAGASHVIVTSYVFHDGGVDTGRIERLCDLCSKKRIVLDLSCKRRDDGYYIVTDRWSTMTDIRVDIALLEHLAGYCDEFLIHAADVEGKTGGVEDKLVELLGGWHGNPVTYAGGVSSYDDILSVKALGGGRVNLTIGSALDIYGGRLNFETTLSYFRDI